jgi:hypothetical protein
MRLMERLFPFLVLFRLRKIFELFLWGTVLCLSLIVLSMLNTNLNQIEYQFNLHQILLPKYLALSTIKSLFRLLGGLLLLLIYLSPQFRKPKT